jgi:catechol 2,3-dioxygenase-like lactoylglutathione lyase family enzyme
MNFKLKYLSPLLFTKDLAQTILFYETILGFKAQSNFPNFVSLTRDDVNIMFVLPTQEPEELNDPGNKEEFFSRPQLTGNIFIFTDQVDQIWDSVKDKVTIKSPIADREYLMRDFSILDNNSYELVFGEDISSKKQVTT